MTPEKFDPAKQRLSYVTGMPVPRTLPKLTDLQLAVLACVRDDLIVAGRKYLGWRTLDIFVVFGRFDVTSQIRSLKKRGLIKYPARDSRHAAHFSLTPWGVAELDQHPEF